MRIPHQAVRHRPIPALVALAAILAVVALAAPQGHVARDVVGGGGGDIGSGKTRLVGTVGQDVVGPLTRPAKAPSYGLRSGFWQPAGAVSAAPETPVAMPVGLRGNVPNPFNPRTEIRFSVGESAARARLRIFDARGRLVRTLVDGLVQPGPQRVAWSGRDDHGRNVASGVFFSRLEVDGEMFTQKMLLLK